MEGKVGGDVNETKDHFAAARLVGRRRRAKGDIYSVEFEGPVHIFLNR